MNGAALLVAGALLAQAPTPVPIPAPKPVDTQPAADSRPPLKLMLDDADLRQMNRSIPAPAPKESEGGLPTLGGDARRIELPPSRPGSARSYPEDTRQPR